MKLGSYVELIFSDPVINDEPENWLFVVSRLLPAIEDCESWWSQAEFLLEPLRFLESATAPWGTLVRVTGHGRNPEEARKTWGMTMGRLTQAVMTLPQKFEVAR